MPQNSHYGKGDDIVALEQERLDTELQNVGLTSKEQRYFFQRERKALFGTAIYDTGEIKASKIASCRTREIRVSSD